MVMMTGGGPIIFCLGVQNRGTPVLNATTREIDFAQLEASASAYLRVYSIYSYSEKLPRYLVLSAEVTGLRREQSMIHAWSSGVGCGTEVRAVWNKNCRP